MFEGEFLEASDFLQRLNYNRPIVGAHINLDSRRIHSIVVCCARDLSMYPLCVDSHTNSAERCITDKILLINLKTF